MLIEVSGVCQQCAEKVKVLMLNGKALANCHKCSGVPFGLKPVKGIIYVVNNPNQIGVKIGFTTKPIEHRLRSLNATGVAGNFVPVAMFPSDRPRNDERKVHDKLRRHVIAKEHFKLDPIEAVLKAYRALNKRQPIFLDSGNEQTFNLKLEEARIKMQLRLRGTR